MRPVGQRVKKFKSDRGIGSMFPRGCVARRLVWPQLKGTEAGCGCKRDNEYRLIIRNEHAGIGSTSRSDEFSPAEEKELDGERPQGGQLEQGQPQRERTICGRGRSDPETFTKL